MRFDTINAANYLVWRLQHAGNVMNMRDDGDLIYVQLRSTQQPILIYLVEREMPLTDLQYHFNTNTQKGIHTLMIYWVDMLLPRPGSPYLMNDWMEALVSVQGDKIYGFEVAGREAYFFPVYFDGSGRMRRIRYGNIVNYHLLNTSTVTSHWPTMTGTWHVAGFSHQDYASQQQTQSATTNRAPVAAYFQVLGVQVNASPEMVKQAYYKLARQYHPDLNATDEAHQRMKQINDAYRRIIKHFEQENKM